MANFTTDGKLCMERDIVISSTTNISSIIPQFDIIQTCEWITTNGFTKVCLQFSDELLCISANIYEELKSRIDIDFYILGDTSYASCCVDSVASMHVDADAVVHYGHSCFSKSNIPELLVLPKHSLDIETSIEPLKAKFELNSKLCFFYGAEFDHMKDVLINSWFENYPEACVAYIEKEDKHKKFLGRVIRNKTGLEKSVESLKEFICVYLGARGNTLFNYTISIAATDWYQLHPNKSLLERMDETSWFKRRRYLIEKCKDANTIGILICKLAGEQTKDIISRMKQICKINGKKSYIVSVGKPNVAKLANFPEIDIYVMIACPENELYSSRDFYKPIIYPFELEVALNSNRENYSSHHITDYDELLPGRKYYCDIDHIKELTDVSLITGKIRETCVSKNEEGGMQLAEKNNWAVESIGHQLLDRSWKGLEQNLGETEVKKVEKGRTGIALQYSNESQ